MDLEVDQAGNYSQKNASSLFDRIEKAGNGNYDLLLADGGRVKFVHTGPLTGASYGLIATEIVDPYGQKTILTRDGQGHLSTIAEPGGRSLQIHYKTYSFTIAWPVAETRVVNVIDYIQAMDGRGNVKETVRYTYEPERVSVLWYYNLSRVDYDDNTFAAYTYFPSNAVTMVSGSIRTCDDARYAGAMSRIEYEYENPTLDGTVAYGQVKGEKYPGASTFISRVTSPPSYPNYVSSFNRTETRADGETRTFKYHTDGSEELASYTDFKGHLSQIAEDPLPFTSNTRTIFTDARQNQTLTDRDRTFGTVMSVKRGTGQPVTYTYSNHYYMSSRTDENGKTTYFDRDAKNRIWQIRYPDGGVEQFAFNDFGQVVDHLMTSGGTEHFEYYPDNRGLKWKYWPPATNSDPDPWKSSHRLHLL